MYRHMAPPDLFTMHCSGHGHSHGLVSEDVENYLETFDYSKPGSIADDLAAEVTMGCPGSADALVGYLIRNGSFEG
jgi:hypothetical protein